MILYARLNEAYSLVRVDFYLIGYLLFPCSHLLVPHTISNI